MTPRAIAAISVANVVKRFRYLGIAKQTTLKELFVKTVRGQTHSRRTIEAIAGVSFSVPAGKALGIVGRNGSGKTTLLRMLAGVYAPDEGRIAISGSLAPLLSLAAGFHPDLTGRENARIELMVLGYSPKQIQERMDQIVTFAEVGDLIDAPVRTYSSGMMMRLAFAAAISVDPDVLLLDEVLAVGDAPFAEKCLRCIDDFRARGKTIVLVTHSMEMVRERCDLVMWLDQGKIMAFGEPDMVLDAYRKAMAATKELERPAKRPALRTAIVYGNCQAEALSNILKKDELFGSLFRVVYCHNYDAPGQDRNLPASEDLSACALLFSQHGPEPFAFADRLPKECLTVRFPSVDFNLLWPFHCINPYNKPQLPELPWGPFPYGDRIILDCIEKGMAPDDILEYYLNGWAQYKVDLKHITRLDQARLEARDGHCDIEMTSWVMERFRSQRLFWTINHPTQTVLREVVQRLLNASVSVEPALLEVDIEKTQGVLFPNWEQLGMINIPIHPNVAEELRLTWYDINRPFSSCGRTYSYEQYFREMIDYCVSERAAGAPVAASA